MTESFRELVVKMRAAQKQYFRSRSHDSLEESKRLERLVDAELKSGGQPTLFREQAQEQ